MVRCPRTPPHVFVRATRTSRLRQSIRDRARSWHSRAEQIPRRAFDSQSHGVLPMGGAWKWQPSSPSTRKPLITTLTAPALTEAGRDQAGCSVPPAREIGAFSVAVSDAQRARVKPRGDPRAGVDESWHDRSIRRRRGRDHRASSHLHRRASPDRRTRTRHLPMPDSILARQETKRGSRQGAPTATALVLS